MESLSVEDLDIGFSRDRASSFSSFSSQEGKPVLLEETAFAEFTRNRASSFSTPLTGEQTMKTSPTWSQEHDQIIVPKHGLLPSLQPAREAKGRNVLGSCERGEAIWRSPNVPSADEQAIPIVNNSQLLLSGKRATEPKLGKLLLAPLPDRNQSSPDDVSLVKGTQDRGETKSDRPHSGNTGSRCFKTNPINSEAEKRSPLQKGCHSEYPTKPKPKLLAPGLTDEEAITLDFPHTHPRRFSAPISPRFVRRLIPERFYSSPRAVDGYGNENDSYKKDVPDRGSIFSPPSQEFDAITGEQRFEESGSVYRDSSPPNSKLKAHRKSLDLNLNVNRTRFLSEIKVSLTARPSEDQPSLFKGRHKPENRKKSYSLSGSAETLTTKYLPPVGPQFGHKQDGRSRAFSNLEAKPLGQGRKNDQQSGHTLFDSPMFLEPGSQRLSHLSLSPRLPRKF